MGTMSEFLQGTADDQLLDETNSIMNDFVFEMISSDEDSKAKITRSQLGGESNDPKLKTTVHLLMQYGKKLDKDEDLQRIFKDQPITKELIKAYFWEIYSKGEWSYGNVAMLFYLIGKLVMETIITLDGYVVDIIKTIISYFVDFIRDNLINCICKHGGWLGFMSLASS